MTVLCCRGFAKILSTSCNKRGFYIKHSILWGLRALVKLLIEHMELSMFILHVKIIAFQPNTKLLRTDILLV